MLCCLGCVLCHHLIIWIIPFLVPFFSFFCKLCFVNCISIVGPSAAATAAAICCVLCVCVDAYRRIRPINQSRKKSTHEHGGQWQLPIKCISVCVPIQRDLSFGHGHGFKTARHTNHWALLRHIRTGRQPSDVSFQLSSIATHWMRIASFSAELW